MYVWYLFSEAYQEAIDVQKDWLAQWYSFMIGFLIVLDIQYVMEWDVEKCLVLTDEQEKHPKLWNPQHGLQYNKGRKNDC